MTTCSRPLNNLPPVEPILNQVQEDGGYVQDDKDLVREHNPIFTRKQAEEALLLRTEY
jgi:hypothetical protein